MDEHMEEVIAFWLALMEDAQAKTADRLKASENLARYFCREPDEEETARDRELVIRVEYGELPCS